MPEVEPIQPQVPRPQQPNVEPKPQVEVKPNMPQQPNVEQKPQVEVKPNIPQQPNIEQKPQVEVKPQQPQVNQDIQPNMPEVEPIQPQVPRPQQPNIEQKPQVEVKPNIPQQPNVEQRPQVEVKPNIPQQPNIEQKPQVEVKPNMPQQPNVEQRPQVEVKPNILPPPTYKLEIDLQEYMRYETLKPNMQNNRIPQPEILNTHIKPEPHYKPHHHKLPPLIEKPINQETVAAMNVMQNLQQPQEATMTQMRQRLSGDAAELFFTGLINLNDLSETLKTNSNSAKSKLILAMANASKQGIDNSQINDTLKMLTASMSATENSTPAKILKNIIELYLPWYPLQQGVGFDLSIETKPGVEDFLSVLKIWIQTRNYGNINAILTLVTTNSVDMNIKCAEDFPKDNLLKRLHEETANNTMQSNISIEEVAQREGYIDNEQQAKVNLSSTYELNPYLLLMAHSFIKNTIVIDSNSTIS